VTLRNQFSQNFIHIYGQRIIFIDVSVKGSDFAKYSACSISLPSHQSKLPTRFVSGYSHHKQAIVMHAQKNRIRFAIDYKSSGFSI